MKLNRDKIEELIIDHVDGKLSGKEKEYIESMIKRDAEISSMYNEYRDLHRRMKKCPEEIPERQLEQQFYQMLENEKSKHKKKIIPVQVQRVTKTMWFKVAASVALVIIGILIGRFWIGPGVGDGEITALKQDMEETKAVLRQVIDGNLSASKRLAHVQVSYELENPDQEILNVLIRTMNTDENVNVRLSAIRALSGFTDDPEVKTALVQSLERQEDPFIQMMLINILVEIREKNAVKEFEKLIEKESVDQTVKDEAQMGIFKLS